MNNSDFREIERLVSALYDEGLSPQDMARLEALLVDNPIAQKQYRGLVDTHIALTIASSSLEAVAEMGEQSNRPQSAPLYLPTTATVPTLSTPHSWAWPLTTAAALLLAFGLLALQSWSLWSSGTLPSSSHYTELTTIPSITHVSWEGPAFQSRADQSLPLTTISPGAITLRLQKGKTAEGYVICLRPGMSVDLVASFDATGENSLSIVEFTGGPQPAAKKLTFHNAGEGPKPFHANPAAKNRRYGVLGHWTEANAGLVPRFFLLTGVHKLARPAPGEEWRLSELEVLLENEEAVHIGWDDSGPAPNDGEPYQQDGDYDDLAASLFYSPIDNGVSEDASDPFVISGDDDSHLKVAGDLGAGFAFDLPPGAMAMVKGVSEARYPSGMLIVDAYTKEVLWSRTKPPTSTAYVGAACVSNRSLASRALRVVAVHKTTAESTTWQVSKVKVLYDQPRFSILGFDDALGDDDYNDVRINLLIDNPRPSGTASVIME